MSRVTRNLFNAKDLIYMEICPMILSSKCYLVRVIMNKNKQHIELKFEVDDYEKANEIFDDAKYQIEKSNVRFD